MVVDHQYYSGEQSSMDPLSGTAQPCPNHVQDNCQNTSYHKIEECSYEL